MATYHELLVEREELDKRIEEARKAELSDAIQQVTAIIKKYGLTAAECGFGSSTNEPTEVATSTRAPAKPKYITPDGKKTWTGRGRAPKEFQVLIDAGRDKEEFLIK
jgi:DNA-binding protein H-NS